MEDEEVDRQSGGEQHGGSRDAPSLLELAHTRIKQEHDAMEVRIAQMREGHRRTAEGYIREAEEGMKKNREKAASPSRATTNMTTTTTTSKSHPVITSPPPTVVIRGFNAPGSSPSPSSASSPKPAPPTISPYTSPSSLYPSLPGSYAQKNKSKQQQVAQPMGPQSPSFRRSRSPSPSRDAARRTGGSQSRERASSKERSTAGSSSMEKTDSGNSQQSSATSRRPIDLEKDVDVSKQQADASKSNKATTAPHHSSLKNPLPASSALSPTRSSTFISGSYASRSRPPTSGGAWLRLNDVATSASSPSTSRSLLQSMEDEVNRIGKEKADQAAARKTAETDASGLFGSSVVAGSYKGERPSIKERHVSFKEPDKVDTKQTSEGRIQPEHGIIEAEETMFELDEDVDLSSDEDDSEETIASSVASIPDPAASDEPKAKASSAFPPGLASYREQHKDLIKMLDNAGSFVDTLKRVHTPKKPIYSELDAAYEEAYSGLGERRYYGSTRMTGSGFGKPPIRHASSTLTPEVAARLKEQAQELRHSLAMDIPSHRTRKSKSRKGKGREAEPEEEEEEITDEQMNQLAPVYNMASSLPIAIGFSLRPGQKQDYEFERKTSVPNRENMMVPRLKRDPTNGGGLAVLDEEGPTPLASAAGTPTEASARDKQLGGTDIPGAKEAREEAIEEASTMDVSVHSPPVPKLDTVSSGTDAQVADMNRDNVGDEQEEARDEVKGLRGEKDGFVPPHIWARKKVEPVEMLGTSVHDYD